MFVIFFNEYHSKLLFGFFLGSSGDYFLNQLANFQYKCIGSSLKSLPVHAEMLKDRIISISSPKDST